MSTPRVTKILLVGMAALVALPVLASPAAAKTADVPLNTYAWWWRDAERAEEIDIAGNKIEAPTAPNPYCPATSGTVGTGGGAISEDACQLGRLPIWIRNGEFERPHMSFGLDIDVSLLSEADLESFKVLLLEADCDPADGRKDTPQCEQTTQPLPADNPATTRNEFETSFRVEVCTVTEIFGEGDGRPVEEMPRLKCDTGIIGERKVLKAPVIKTGDQAAPAHLNDHIWEFDLTELAQGWIDEFTIPTAVYFRAEPPRNPDTSDQFRVVFAGPEDEVDSESPNAKEVQQQPGVEILAVYSGGTGGGLPPVPGDDGTDFGTDTGTTTTGTTDFGTTDTGTTDFGTGTTTPTTPAAPAAPAAPIDLAEEPTGARTEPLPGYVWLAMLAGLAGFSLVRSVVIPSTTGIRPDGVLAQIQALNAQRRGTTLAASAASGPTIFGRIGNGLTSLGKGAAGLVGKLNFFKR